MMINNNKVQVFVAGRADAETSVLNANLEDLRLSLGTKMPRSGILKGKMPKLPIKTN